MERKDIELFFADGAIMTIKCSKDKEEYYVELARIIAEKDKNNPASICWGCKTKR